MTTAIAAPRNDRLVRLALKKIGQAFCRHSFVLVQTKRRLFLRCDSCGAESVGFQLDAPAGEARVVSRL